MEVSKILDELIEKGQDLGTSIEFVPAPRNVMRFHAVYRTTQSEEYQNWISASQRFIKTYYPSDIEEFKEASNKFSPGHHKAMLGILRAIKMMPSEPIKNNSHKPSFILID